MNNNLIHYNVNDINIDYLFYDANSVIHNICNKYMNNNYDIDDVESIIINNTINFFDKNIKLLNPKKLVYIAIDGVVPLSKIT